MKVRSHSLSPSVARGTAILYAIVFVTSVHTAQADSTPTPPATRIPTSTATITPTPTTTPTPTSTVTGTPPTPVPTVAGVVGTGTAASCTDAALNTALAGGGLVTFYCGGAATIAVTNTKTISADTTIDGGSLITISGGHSVGVFSVNTGVKFTVQNLTVANGNNSAGGGFGGGAIANGGTLMVTNSTFTGNSAVSHFNPMGGLAGGFGGGIFSYGPLTVTNSTFTGNSADDAVGGGGAIANGGGPLTVTNSTFTSNSAGYGGGICNFAGPLIVTNSTFTGNSATGSGGGIQYDSALPLPVLRNTIVANNTGGNCGSGDAIITDGGHNVDDGTSCGFSTANESLSNTDPQLDPAGLQNNGGPTQTVALCTGVGMPAGCTAASPAIDAGDQAVCAAAPVNDRDQRGFVRPGTGHTQCSIGAYEADATTPEACIGDCTGTQTVAVNDIIILVNIALGNAEPSACPHGVPTGADVTVAVIIQAVNSALNGCG